MEPDAKLTGFFHQLQIGRAQIGLFIQTVSTNLADMIFDRTFKSRIVTVDQPEPALAEQQGFTIEIFFHRSMLVGTDMICGKVRKYADIISKSGDTVKLQPLRGNLHDAIFAACLDH